MRNVITLKKAWKDCQEVRIGLQDDVGNQNRKPVGVSDCGLTDDEAKKDKRRYGNEFRRKC